jgi:hypothetical protein
MKIDETDAIQTTVRTSQIIVGALASGVAFFGVLVLTVLSDQTAAPSPNGLTFMAVAFGVISLVLSIIMPVILVDSGLRGIVRGTTPDETKPTESGQRHIYPASDVGRLLPLFQTQLIVASALNEGGAFFGFLAYMLEGQTLALAVAGVLVAVILSRFPTTDRVQGWLDARLQRLDALRRGEV